MKTNSTDANTKLMFSHLSDPEQVKQLFLWLTLYQNETEDVLREFAGMFATLRKEIENSPIFGLDFCDRTRDALYSLTIENDANSRQWAERIAQQIAAKVEVHQHA